MSGESGSLLDIEPTSEPALNPNTLDFVSVGGGGGGGPSGGVGAGDVIKMDLFFALVDVLGELHRLLPKFAAILGEESDGLRQLRGGDGHQDTADVPWREAV